MTLGITFSSGERLPPADLQAMVDQIDVLTALCAAVPRTAYKTADEIVNNSSVLQNDDHLVLSVVANAVYTMRLVGGYTAAVAAGLKVDFTAPVGCTFEVPHYLAKVSGTVNYDNTNALLAVSGFSGTAAQVPLTLETTVFVGATAGNIQFRWAQNTANASNATVHKGTYLQVVRIA